MTITIMYNCLAVRTRWRILVQYIPFYVYDCNRPLAPILGQKMVLYGVRCFFTAVYEIKIPGTHFQDQG
jgi:hypothetical protein